MVCGTRSTAASEKVIVLNPELPVNSHGDWLEAIATNNAEYVSASLARASREERDKLLNGNFMYDKHTALRGFKSRAPSTPLQVACANGSLSVIEILFTHGVDPRHTCNGGYNLIHNLVVTSLNRPKVEERCVATYEYVRSTVETGVLRDLLMAETPSGLRAIELAAQQGTLRLMEAIMLTKDVHAMHIEKHGNPPCHLIDVTEYESSGPDSRRNKSPLFFLSNLEAEKLEDDFTLEFFRSSLITQWVRNKTSTHISWLVLWFLQRLTHILLYFIHGGGMRYRDRIDSSSVTNETTSSHVSPYCDNDIGPTISSVSLKAMSHYIVISSCATVLFYMANSFNPHKRKLKQLYYCNIIGNKKTVVNLSFYVIAQLITAIGILLEQLSHWLPDSEHTRAINAVCPIIVVVVGMWSILFFFQGVPGVGPFVVTVQRMILVFINFAVILLAIMVPYSYLFYSFINAHSRQGCINDFSDIMNTFYTLFTIMLNLYPLNSIDVEYSVLLNIVHIIFIFSVSILMLNFLIALLSDNVGSLNKHRDVYLSIQRTSVLGAVEFNFGFLLGRFFAVVAKQVYITHEGRILLPYIRSSEASAGDFDQL